PQPANLLAALRRECARLRPLLLRGARGLAQLPAGSRQSVAFALLAALRMLTLLEEADETLLRKPPQIGVLARLGLLIRARWLRV
ncbi:MAG TPA: hypothetical protein VN851_21135, partial [Thermoanaerobaculia bacterium]|nr:hypothetical protein [Thermoanaerobaculia bacterium]